MTPKSPFQYLYINIKTSDLYYLSAKNYQILIISHNQCYLIRLIKSPCLTKIRLDTLYPLLKISLIFQLNLMPPHSILFNNIYLITRKNDNSWKSNLRQELWAIINVYNIKILSSSHELPSVAARGFYWSWYCGRW